MCLPIAVIKEQLRRKFHIIWWNTNYTMLSLCMCMYVYVRIQICFTIKMYLIYHSKENIANSCVTSRTPSVMFSFLSVQILSLPINLQLMPIHLKSCIQEAKQVICNQICVSLTITQFSFVYNKYNIFKLKRQMVLLYFLDCA